MSRTRIFCMLLLAALAACKTSTNPLDGQQLRLITSDQDTTQIMSGPVTFTLTVLAPSGYGASGAYIDFYDPIEQRARHEGPTPEDGTWQFTDTIQSSLGGGSFEFTFAAEDAGAITSDSLRLWIRAKDIRLWVIASIAANSQDGDAIGIIWSRPAIDSGTDTVFARMQGAIQPFILLAPFPQNSATISVAQNTVDSFTVHNAFASSQPIVWARANYYSEINLYPNGESNYDPFSGLSIENGNAVDIEFPADVSYTDLVLASDPSNQMSGFTIASPSLSSLAGFSGGRTTRLYHPIQFIDSGSNLQELFYSNDLSTYVNGATPIYEIPLTDSNQYSTAFIAVTEDGNYARVCLGPVTHDWEGYQYVQVALSYQPTVGLPYAGRGRKR